jgi:hypothetical protein
MPQFFWILQTLFTTSLVLELLDYMYNNIELSHLLGLTFSDALSSWQLQNILRIWIEENLIPNPVKY